MYSHTINDIKLCFLFLFFFLLYSLIDLINLNSWRLCNTIASWYSTYKRASVQRQQHKMPMPKHHSMYRINMKQLLYLLFRNKYYNAPNDLIQ